MLGDAPLGNVVVSRPGGQFIQTVVAGRSRRVERIQIELDIVSNITRIGISVTGTDRKIGQCRALASINVVVFWRTVGHVNDVILLAFSGDRRLVESWVAVFLGTGLIAGDSVIAVDDLFATEVLQCFVIGLRKRGKTTLFHRLQA